MENRPEAKLITDLQKHQQWIQPLREANCSCLIIIKNKTSDILFRTDFLLESGMWRQFPDEMVKPMDHIVFGSESFGFCTGTSGRVEYRISGSDDVFRMEWDIPFFTESLAKVSEHQNYRISKEEYFQTKKTTIEFTIHDPFDGDYRYNNRPINLISTIPIVNESWKIQQSKAQRNVLITLSNTTEYRLKLVQSELRHGIWSMAPPSEVVAFTSYDFGSESHGLMATEGEVVYQILNNKNQIAEGTINFAWDIPMLGAPQFSSNIFAVEPRVLGNHSEIVLHFSSDETFLLQFNETSSIEKPQNPASESASTNLEKPDEPKPSLEEQTSYGFDG